MATPHLRSARPSDLDDLAVLEVKGVQSPPRPIPANLTTAEADFTETMPVITLGFPGGRALGGVASGTVDSTPSFGFRNG